MVEFRSRRCDDGTGVPQCDPAPRTDRRRYPRSDRCGPALAGSGKGKNGRGVTSRHLDRPKHLELSKLLKLGKTWAKNRAEIGPKRGPMAMRKPLIVMDSLM